MFQSSHYGIEPSNALPNKRVSSDLTTIREIFSTDILCHMKMFEIRMGLPMRYDPQPEVEGIHQIKAHLVQRKLLEEDFGLTEECELWFELQFEAS